ncbi:SDR family oxidoreductase [Silvibacterium acidisoli]|uniref:SDR family oxidoreductase n=1 Tax=Acidobacteriaceae bacterium ZG23-2 TaxID=2883246 RepID=UPI00406D0111
MILVTGATGQNGSEIIGRLAAKGVQVRAMSRSGNGSQDAPANVEYVPADFDNEASLRKALDGVERAFLVTNSSDRVEKQQLRFVKAATESGVQHVVYLSQLHAALNSPCRFLHYHAVVERGLARSGMAYTNLRPNLYMQGILMLGKSIASEGKLFAPAGDCRVSIIDVRDIASVAVAALTEPGHEGRTYDLTGPEALTHAEMAARISSAISKPVAFVDIPESEFRSALAAFHMPGWQAEGLVEDYAHYRRGEAADISGAVQEVTNNAPRNFAEFTRDFRPAFLGEERTAAG